MSGTNASQSRPSAASIPPTAPTPPTEGAAYEPLTGRWSRLIAPDFIDWLDVPDGRRWLDVGCGTGALIEAILSEAEPADVVGIDPSSAYIAYARRQIDDPRVRYEVGDIRALPVASNQCDAAVAGLVLNLLPPAAQVGGVREMARGARNGGTVGAYVWDYAAGMEPRARFWAAATALDPDAWQLDQRTRYPLCQPEALAQLFTAAGLNAVETTSLQTAAHFRDFDDYWLPYLAGSGSASIYALGLPEDRRDALRETLRADLPQQDDGSIQLTVQAFAVKGVR